MTPVPIDPVDVGFPFAGRWLVQNSPANRTPSHGTTLFASAHAIDFVPVDETGRTAPITAATLVRPEPPALFPGFGRPILSPVDGVVIAAHDAQIDHRAHRGLPSIGYALGQGGRARSGWTALAGNVVLIAVDTIVIALCHLRQSSIVVRSGDRVLRGEPIASCGNSGNSTEPHLHVQAMDHFDDTRLDPAHARPVPLTFDGRCPSNGEIVDAPRRR